VERSGAKVNMSYYFAILRNENEQDHLDWIKACEQMKNQVRYKVIDITRYDWLENSLAEEFDMLLARPPGAVSFFKQLYDERIYILNHVLGKKIYPTYEEILIYENKRMLSYWLNANQIPHPRTRIFYHKDEAVDFSRQCRLPMVAKTAIGASGTGVRILRKQRDVEEYIDTAFSNRGITRKWGPNVRKGDFGKRTLNRLKNIPGFVKYMKNKRASSIFDPQRWFVIFQEYIKCDFEWRCVRIGDSFFGHKKLATRGEIISGTSEVSWEAPSERLLNFVKEVTDRQDFLSQAIDIFEPEPGKFLVNEMQCFWGSKNPHQMIIDGKPGRYIPGDSEWIFEPGNFNINNSYDLRLNHVIEILNNKKQGS
jgi:glutathione synthase/RimK-type ligase-like ATP-grasp enzyme